MHDWHEALLTATVVSLLTCGVTGTLYFLKRLWS
jgi:predicted small lipoprotein YifL